MPRTKISVSTRHAQDYAQYLANEVKDDLNESQTAPLLSHFAKSPQEEIHYILINIFIIYYKSK